MNSSDKNHLQLSALQDGQLTPRQAGKLRRKLERDPALRGEQTQLAALNQTLQTVWPAPIATPDVRARVMARVQRDLAATRRTLWPTAWGRPAWSFAWACSGLLAGLLLWGNLIHQIDEQQATQSLGNEITLAMAIPLDEAADFQSAVDEAPLDEVE